MNAKRDSLDRRQRLAPVSTGKRVTLQESDRLWLAKLAEHGPLPTSFLLAYTQAERRSEKRARERLTDLFHEANTPHGGRYLDRPLQQFRTIDSRYNQLVYDLAPAGRKALDLAGASGGRGGPWVHRFMVACIAASIDLAARDRADIDFIPAAVILDRAGARLRHPVTVAEPGLTRAITKDLLPDGLFGLRYRTRTGDRFRFFLIEADRSTEPAASSSWHRKSLRRTFLQYRAYIGGGAYRQHLKLTAPLLVLTVATVPERVERMLRLVSSDVPDAAPYLLFQHWDAFGPVFRPPVPHAPLLAGPWQRADGSRFQIDAV